jgi:hypothetical protein
VYGHACAPPLLLSANVSTFASPNNILPDDDAAVAARTNAPLDKHPSTVTIAGKTAHTIHLRRIPVPSIDICNASLLAKRQRNFPVNHTRKQRRRYDICPLKIRCGAPHSLP